MNTNKNLGKNTLKREEIEKMTDVIRLSDRDEETGLELFCYVNSGPGDSQLARECRGVVYNGEELVMRAFPYTVEYSHHNTSAIEEHIQPIFSECQFYDSYEGALIRMFYYQNKWFISTHRKLNAYKSKWVSTETFGESFVNALDAEIDSNTSLQSSLGDGFNNLEKFQNSLDKDKQYMFLVLHNEENRIVCLSPPRPTLFHVGTFVNGELSMTENINVTTPQKHNFLSMDDLVDFVNNVDIRHQQGVIVFAPGNKQFKVVNDRYMNFFQARGNEPSIKFRYLQVRMNQVAVENLCLLYPNMVSEFDECENMIYGLAKVVYDAYVQRYIKKQWVTVAPEEFNVMKECHLWHVEDRKINRISMNKIIDVLNSQTPTNLNKMLKRFKLGTNITPSDPNDPNNHNNNTPRENKQGSKTSARPSARPSAKVPEKQFKSLLRPNRVAKN